MLPSRRLPADPARHPPRPQPGRPGARPQRGQDPRAHRRSCRPSTPTSATGCGCWCSATTSAPRATLPVDLRGVVDEQAGSAPLALEHLAGRAAPAPAAGHRVDGGRRRTRRCRPAPGVRRTRPDLVVRRRAARGRLDQPRLGAVGDPVLRGRPLPGAGRHPRPARRGLGRPCDHRPGRPHHRDDQHRRRADPRAGRCATTRAGRRRSRSPGRVVCVSEDHPKGGNDWDRFVRKHEGFYGVDADGDVVVRRRPRGRGVLAVRAAPVDTLRRATTRGWCCAPSSARRPRSVGSRDAVRRHRSCTPCGSPPAERDRSGRSRPPSCCTRDDVDVRDRRPRRGARTR